MSSRQPLWGRAGRPLWPPHAAPKRPGAGYRFYTSRSLASRGQSRRSARALALTTEGCRCTMAWQHSARQVPRVWVAGVNARPRGAAGVGPPGKSRLRQEPALVPCSYETWTKYTHQHLYFYISVTMWSTSCGLHQIDRIDIDRSISTTSQPHLNHKPQLNHISTASQPQHKHISGTAQAAGLRSTSAQPT